MGRPTKYKKEYCEAVIAHMSSGLSFETFSATIGVCVDSTYEWAKKHEEFSDAKKRGFAAGQLLWEKIGLAGMTGNYNVPNQMGKINMRGFNLGAWIFTGKTRFHIQDPADKPTQQTTIVSDKVAVYQTEWGKNNEQSGNGNQ